MAGASKHSTNICVGAGVNTPHNEFIAADTTLGGCGYGEEASDPQPRSTAPPQSCHDSGHILPLSIFTV